MKRILSARFSLFLLGSFCSSSGPLAGISASLISSKLKGLPTYTPREGILS